MLTFLRVDEVTAVMGSAFLPLAALASFTATICQHGAGQRE